MHTKVSLLRKQEAWSASILHQVQFPRERAVVLDDETIGPSRHD